MTINVKMTVPVYKTNQYGSFDRKADIQIAGDFDSLSEGYAFLRVEIDQLLKQSQAENTLLLNLHDLEVDISNKKLISEGLDRKILTATRQLQRLQSFLERLGIDPSSYQLSIATLPITPGAVAVEAEVDPIPFDLNE